MHESFNGVNSNNFKDTTSGVLKFLTLRQNYLKKIDTVGQLCGIFYHVHNFTFMLKDI